MTIALLSDIHANFEALTVVLDEVRRRNVDEIICLGDIIGYGPDPVECIATLRGLKIPCLMGNHDAAASDVNLRTTFSPLARKAMEWTTPQLGEHDLSFLRSLPYTVEAHGQTLVHAAPLNPANFDYILDNVDAARNFPGFTTPICFIGHTHQPDIFCDDFRTRHVAPGKRYIVNAGSVGQPRDGDARACFGLFHSDAYSFEHIRIAYDVPTTAEKIYKSGLPRQLGDRLVLGV